MKWSFGASIDPDHTQFLRKIFIYHIQPFWKLRENQLTRFAVVNPKKIVYLDIVLERNNLTILPNIPCIMSYQSQKCYQKAFIRLSVMLHRDKQKNTTNELRWSHNLYRSK